MSATDIMPFISVVPSVRTIPGIDEFDYRIEPDADVRVGDVILVPFRSRELPAMIVAKKPMSVFADRIRDLTNPPVLLRGGPEAAELLGRSARHAFVSRPTVLNSWLRDVPKRGRSGRVPPVVQSSLGGTLERRYLIDRWHGPRGIIDEVKKRPGKRLILTPWQDWANALGKELDAPVLHAGASTTTAWKAVQDFTAAGDGILVSTRVGAWLCLFADVVILDEPENDDFKQDELSPRLDARWVVAEAASLRPGLSVIAIGTTPRLGTNVPSWGDVPDITLTLTLEPFHGRGKSAVEGISPAALERIAAARSAGRNVVVLHPVRGERARIVCADCAWQATCPSCGFPVSLSTGSTALCRRCGKKSDPPAQCPSCGGSDLSRSRAGTDRLLRQLDASVTVTNLAGFAVLDLPTHAFVVVTDVSLVGGAVEDIRRRERLLISFRRIAAKTAAAQGELYALGPEDVLTDAREWLASAGVAKTWEAEAIDRKTFGYPPATKLAKILVTGTESDASRTMDELRNRVPPGLELRGPFPIEYRSTSRGRRFVLHAVATGTGSKERDLRNLLEPLAGRAIIDLDPVAFFA